MVFLYFLARPDWQKGYGFPDFFPAGNRSGLDTNRAFFFESLRGRDMPLRGDYYSK